MYLFLIIFITLNSPFLSVSKTLVNKTDATCNENECGTDEFKSSSVSMDHSIRVKNTPKKENFIEYAPSFQWNRRAYMTSREVSKQSESNWIDVDKFPSDSACSIVRCVNICKVIYREAEQYLAQCMGHDCFCFKKDPPFSPALRDFMKKYTFFGIPQIYN